MQPNITQQGNADNRRTSGTVKSPQREGGNGEKVKTSKADKKGSIYNGRTNINIFEKTIQNSKLTREEVKSSNRKLNKVDAKRMQKSKTNEDLTKQNAKIEKESKAISQKVQNDEALTMEMSQTDNGGLSNNTDKETIDKEQSVSFQKATFSERFQSDEPPSTSQKLRRMVAGNEKRASSKRFSRVSFGDIGHIFGITDKEFYDEFLDYHNRFRKLHTCPPLSMSMTLMKIAKTRVEIISKKSPEEALQQEAGENIFMLESNAIYLTPEKVVRQWYDEKKNYDFDEGQYREDSKHFTQLIWKASENLGVALLRDEHKAWVIAIYEPIGNVADQFSDNVFPISKEVNDIWPSVLFERQCLMAHNKFRSKHGCPLLKINKNLNHFAGDWVQVLAEGKTLEHSRTSIYGQNVFSATSKSFIPGEQVVKIWYDEISKYDFDEGKFSPKTGHFTQVIWKSTTDLGVGQIRDGKGTWIVCYYDPPGNYPGEFLENVPPVYSRPSAIAVASPVAGKKLSFDKQVLEVHNKYRKYHGALPLVLSSTLTEFASERAEYLSSRNSMERNSKNKFGENIYMAQLVPYITAERVVQAWYDDISKYDFVDPKFSAATACFAQVVWLDTKELGVGISRKDGSTWVVCNYKPPGNYSGLFEAKVPPVGKPLYVDPNAMVPFERQCLLAHNEYRAKHGCPPLKLNKKLSSYAYDWAETIKSRNALEYRWNKDIGECILMGVGYFIYTGQHVTETWYKEIEHYNFKKPEFCKAAVNFTQLIWKSTKDLGVGFIQEDDLTIVVANYYPRGNLRDFEENVPPLISSEK